MTPSLNRMSWDYDWLQVPWPLSWHCLNSDSDPESDSEFGISKQSCVRAWVNYLSQLEMMAFDDDDDGRFFRHLGLYYLTIIWLFLNIGCSILDLLYCHMPFNLLLFHCTALSCMLSGLSVLQRQRPLALACLCTLAHQHGPCIHLLSLLRPLLRASLLLPCCCLALQPALQLSQLPPAGVQHPLPGPLEHHSFGLNFLKRDIGFDSGSFYSESSQPCTGR